MLPHVAAGDNLDLPFVGGILRGGGAFFMRRQFGADPVYAAVFSEYLYQMFRRGHAVEYFVEGGRSRTGRLLPAHTGMLRMTIEAYRRGLPRPLAFVPGLLRLRKGHRGQCLSRRAARCVEASRNRRRAVSKPPADPGVVRHRPGQVRRAHRPRRLSRRPRRRRGASAGAGSANTRRRKRLRLCQRRESRVHWQRCRCRASSSTRRHSRPRSNSAAPRRARRRKPRLRRDGRIRRRSDSARGRPGSPGTGRGRGTTPATSWGTTR